jgi:hypothetical protein
MDHDPVHIGCHCMVVSTNGHSGIIPTRHPSKFVPTSKARQVESEVWALRFGSPGKQQLDVLPHHVIGTPPVFEYHPFHSFDFKEQAYIQKQVAQRTAEQIAHCGQELFMDFRFLCTSTDDYKWPNKSMDRIVVSYNSHCTYLLIVDSALQ